RIAASRRSRALAALGRLTSHHLAGKELGQEFKPLLGTVSAEGGKIFSERYGSLGFLTPVSELKFDAVSKMEKESYERWRRGYEGGWAKFFDPIAIRLKLAKEREELDMTILPLRVDSDYQELVALVGETKLSKAAATVPGESVFHFALALDPESDMFKEANVTLVDLLPSLKINPLGWMGKSASVTLGYSLAWQSNFGLSSLNELPVLARVEVASRVKLALFLAALKGAIESSSPELVSWETRQHGGKSYVAMIGNGEEIGEEFSIYYAALPSALLVTLSEEMLKRALDQEKVMPSGELDHAQVMASTSPRFLTGAGEVLGEGSLEARRRILSWAALPILNEWYQSQSAEDPVGFHEQRFANRITCPGGLGYRWNVEDLTMESVAYGHPGNSRDEAKPLAILQRFKTLEMRSSFEEGGMRLQISADEKSTFQHPQPRSAPRPADDKVVPYRDLIALKPGTEIVYESLDEGDEEGEGNERYEMQIDSVIEKGELIVVSESYRNIYDGEEESGRSQTEIGPKGARITFSEGEGKLIPDPEAYDFPAELWPGQVFGVRKNEIWVTNDGRESYRVEAQIKVIGWEAINGPDGKELQALKLERQSMSLSDRNFDRETAVDWYVRGYGLVKSTSSSSWGKTTTRMTVFKEPH
ncbi:hypothetical protein N9A94_03290, partial [Akkermansiaceae bacterium]|nr:hypothetical protein [Akkermansiaceae bacterium]